MRPLRSYPHRLMLSRLPFIRILFINAILFSLVVATTTQASRQELSDSSRNSTAPSVHAKNVAQNTTSVTASTAVTITVDGRANIFAAGQTEPPELPGGGGVLPVMVPIFTQEDQAVSISNVTGEVRCDPRDSFGGADGTGCSSTSTDIESLNGISGIVNNQSSLFMVGVFLDDAPPQDPAPSRLDFSSTALGQNFRTLTPQIGQTFFIGDGLANTELGSEPYVPQQFIVPTNATRLFLGFADADAFRGFPGWYDDNDGQLTASVQVGDLLVGTVGSYVAMGDSFSSGEGAHPPYDESTDWSGNMCHRSSEYSYAGILDKGINSVNLRLIACSGAETKHVWNTKFYGEWPQLDKLSYLNGSKNQVSFVTISIGGNDSGFANALRSCVEGRVLHDGAGLRFGKKCTGLDNKLNKNIYALCQDSAKLLGGCVDSGNLVRLYREIKRRSPHARILVVGYPKLFNKGSGVLGWWGCTYAGIRILSGSELDFLNSKNVMLNDIIRRSVQISGVAEYIDTYEAFKGHEVCTGDASYINGLDLNSTAPPVGNESFHPNRDGYKAMAKSIDDHLKQGLPGQHINISPNQHSVSTLQILAGQASATFSTRWPGSDVVLSLTSPSGRTIDRSTQATDIVHDVGPTYEVYNIANPEPGSWSVNLFGADVAPQGEEVVLQMTQAPPIHMPPTAVVTQSVILDKASLTVQLDATGSTASSGQIVDYSWDFGDGTSGSGPTPSHTYARPGTYTPILIVTDDNDTRGYAPGSTITLPGVYLPMVQQ